MTQQIISNWQSSRWQAVTRRAGGDIRSARLVVLGYLPGTGSELPADDGEVRFSRKEKMDAAYEAPDALIARVAAPSVPPCKHKFIQRTGCPTGGLPICLPANSYERCLMNMPSIGFGLPEGIEYDQINKVYSVRLPEMGQLVTYAYLGAIGLGYSRVSSHAPINYGTAVGAIRLRDAVREHLVRQK